MLASKKLRQENIRYVRWTKTSINLGILQKHLLMNFATIESNVFFIGNYSGIIYSNSDNLMIYIWIIQHNDIDGKCQKADWLLLKSLIGIKQSQGDLTWELILIIYIEFLDESNLCQDRLLYFTIGTFFQIFPKIIPIGWLFWGVIFLVFHIF